MVAHRRSRFAPLRYRAYRRLWTASFVSDMGDAVGRIALTILIQRETDSALLTGLVVAISALPFLGFGQWATARLASVDRRRLLVAADLVRGVCFAAMTLPIGVAPRLGLLLVASLATPPFEAVAGAAIARSVPDAVLGRANGLRTAATEFAFVGGFAIGGLVAEVATPIAVIGVDAASFLVSAAIIARTQVPAGEVIRVVHVREGFQAIARHPLCRRVVVLTTVAFSLVLVPETLVAVYTAESLPDATGATGVLASIVALGVIATTLLRRPEENDSLIRHASLTVALAAGASAAAFGGGNSVAVAAVAYLGIGPVLAVRVHAWTVLGHEIDDELLAPAFSIASGALSAAHLVAGLGGGALSDAFGVDRVATIATAAAATLGLISLLVPVRGRIRTAVPG